MSPAEYTSPSDARAERRGLDDADEIDPRSLRALTEEMTVRPLPDGRYAVESASGATYVVDMESWTCTCPDHAIRGVRCKHVRRVALEIAAGDVPAPWDPRECASCGRLARTSGTPPLCADCRLEPGDLVLDRETGDPLLVVGLLEERAGEAAVSDGDHTVAEHPSNEGYDPDDVVVEIVYPFSVRPDEPPQRYRFPRARVERVTPRPEDERQDTLDRVTNPESASTDSAGRRSSGADGNPK